MSDRPELNGNGNTRGSQAYNWAIAAATAILGVLCWNVFQTVNDTARMVNAIRIDISVLNARYDAFTDRLIDHDRRIGELEHWRNLGAASNARTNP